MTGIDECAPDTDDWDDGPDTCPLARKVAAFRDFMVEVTQREWVG